MNIININTPFVLLKNWKRLLKILNTLKLNFLLLHVGTLTYVTKKCTLLWSTLSP